MSDQDLVRLAAEALAAETPAPVDPTSAERTAAIGAIRAAVRERNHRASVRRWAGYAAAAAVLVTAGGAGVWALRGPISPPSGVVLARGLAGLALVSSHQTMATLAGQMSVEAGARITTPRGAQVALDFETGSRVELGGAADLTLEETRDNQRLFLAAGAADFRVAKVRPGARFLVGTRDTQVEVRGTAFSVGVVPADPGCGDGTTTRVFVREGQVRVEHHGTARLLGPGERWPNDCDAEAKALPTEANPVSPSAAPNPLNPSATANPFSPSGVEGEPTPGPATAALRPPRPASKVATHAAPPAPVAPVSPVASAARVTPPAPIASTLAEQNDLLAKAMALRNAGDAPEAVRVLDGLVGKYPDGALAESALVERMNLLRGFDPKRGAQAAGEYLRRYPNGFARAEAEVFGADRP